MTYLVHTYGGCEMQCYARRLLVCVFGTIATLIEEKQKLIVQNVCDFLFIGP